MKCPLAPVLKLCQSPLLGHCCNSGSFHVASPTCFPYITACQLTQSVVGNTAWDMALESGLPNGTGKLIPLLLCSDTSSCPRCPQQADGISHTLPWPYNFYSTSVTNELVWTMGLSDKTPPELSGLKPSSKIVLPAVWITWPATDLRHSLQFSFSFKGILAVHETLR